MAINEPAMIWFDSLWDFFDNHWRNAGGINYKIWPFEQYFSMKFVNTLNENKAKTHFRHQLERWGEIEQNPPIFEKPQYFQIPGGPKLQRPPRTDSDHEWAFKFVFNSFYNLCCLARYNVTIEELIFIANKYRLSHNVSKQELDEINAQALGAFRKLISLSNSFLLAKWVQKMIYKAIANNDKQFFHYLSLDLEKDTSFEKYDTARAWLGTILLWYLGGKDIRPRKMFMAILQEKTILSKDMTWESFKAMLSNLGLTKKGK